MNTKEENAEAMVQQYLDLCDRPGTKHYYERLIRLVADASFLAGSRYERDCQDIANGIQNSKVH